MTYHTYNSTRSVQAASYTDTPPPSIYSNNTTAGSATHVVKLYASELCIDAAAVTNLAGVSTDCCCTAVPIEIRLLDFGRGCHLFAFGLVYSLH